MTIKSELVMFLRERISSPLTQDPSFRDLAGRVDRLTLAVEASKKDIHEQMQEVHRELTPHTMRDSQEGRGVHIGHLQDYHSGHGSRRV